MRRLINLSAFVLAMLIIVFMLIPTKTVNRNATVYVEHEWDTLENVILGSPKMLSVPQIHKSILGYGYIVNNEKIMKEAPGKPIQQVNPFVYSNITTESDGVAKELKDKSVNVVRFNPEVLDLAELQFMKNIQQGNNFLYPKDAVFVVGNNVIECSQRVPMRDKERYIVRRIFKKLTADDPSVRYIAVPAPSPSFPDKGLYLEGSDVLVDGNNVYVGCSGRGTSPSGVRWLQSVLGPKYKVYRVDFSGFVHLNSVLTLVRPGLGIRVSGAIKSDLPKPIAKWDFIEVKPEDAKLYATSILVVGPNKVLVDERFEPLIEQLRNKNVDVTVVPFEEISGLGGGLSSFYSPIKRTYNKEINTEKINAEYFKKHFNDFLEAVKTFNYSEFFSNIQMFVTEKINTIMHK